jgi:DNA-binding MarR family transcriptional regulator
MSEISKSLLIPKNNLTAVMDKLVEKKYVYRRRSEKDRRIVNIALTSEGKSLYRDENSIQVQLSGKLLKSLEKTDKDMLIALMKKLNGE